MIILIKVESEDPLGDNYRENIITPDDDNEEDSYDDHQDIPLEQSMEVAEDDSSKTDSAVKVECQEFESKDDITPGMYIVIVEFDLFFLIKILEDFASLKWYF